MQPRHVVAERGAEAAGLDEVALHVDDHQRRAAGREREVERSRGEDDGVVHASLQCTCGVLTQSTRASRGPGLR